MSDLLLALAIGVIFGVGIFHMLRRNVVRSAIGIVLLSNAINLLLLTVGTTNGNIPPYTDLIGLRSDALPQALVLTAIVISLGGISVLLAMLLILTTRKGSGDQDEFSDLRH